MDSEKAESRIDARRTDVTLLDIRDLMGHASYRTTEKWYAHLMPNRAFPGVVATFDNLGEIEETD